MTREQVEALAGELNGYVDVQVHGPRAFVITGTELRRIQGLCGRADDALRSLLAERDALRKAADELAAAARECAARPPQQEPRRAQLMAFVQQWKDRTPEAELGTDYMEGKRFCATELEAYLLAGGPPQKEETTLERGQFRHEHLAPFHALERQSGAGENAPNECAKWDCDGDHKYYSHNPTTGELEGWEEA